LTEQSYWRTRPVNAEVLALTTARLDLLTRGPVAGTARAPEHRLVLPFRVLSVLAAQLFDFATFTIMVGRHGIAAEMNPLVAAGFEVFGIPILVAMKTALFVLISAIVVILNRDAARQRTGLAWAALISVLAVAGGLLGGISNALAT
jgi:hypothetical protein